MSLAIYRNSLRSTFRSAGGVTTMIIALLFIVSIILSNSGLYINGSKAQSLGAFVALMSWLGTFLIAQMVGSDLSQELQSQSVRYTMPYTTRTKFLISKIAGALTYWLVVIALGFLIIGVVKGEFNIVELLAVIGNSFFMVSLVTLVSVAITNGSSITFFGVLYAILMTMVDIVSAFYPVWYVKLLTYLFPLKYVMAGNWMEIWLYVSGGIASFIAIIIFKRRAI